jgi:Tol biopolymer transport system component
MAITLSPDGKRALDKDSPYDVPGDLWALDFVSGRRTRLTFRKDVYCPGVWSPDGARIAYAAGNFGDKLYEKASSGGDERELLNEPGLRHYVTDWSRDGRFLLYHTQNAPKTGYDVWILPLQGNRKPVLLLGDTFNEWAAVFSPSMRWIAYASTEDNAGTADIFVRPFRVSEASGVPALGEGKWQVSKDGGNWPRWRSESEIVFLASLPGAALFAAPVNARGAVFESGVPERLSLVSYSPYTGADVSPDGRRFLLAVPQVQKARQNSITVVLNWPALLKK